MSDGSKLTAKQLAFCREYLIDLNATAAYKRAGYIAKGNGAEVNAFKLLRNTKVAEMIQAAMDDRSKRVEIEADYVLRTIVDTVERCRQAEQVMEFNHQTKKMEPTGEWKFDASNVLKGCELLGRHKKLFTDVREHKMDGVTVSIGLKCEE